MRAAGLFFVGADIMVLKPKRPCSKPGCSNLASKRYCAEHEYLAEQEQKERYRYYDQYKRDKRIARFYNSGEWKALRKQALIRDNGLCQDCLDNKRITMATEVDHIVPIKVNWDLRLKLSNLRSLCRKCHANKTAKEKRKYRL